MPSPIQGCTGDILIPQDLYNKYVAQSDDIVELLYTYYLVMKVYASIFQISSFPHALGHPVFIAQRICSIVSDAILLAVTIYYTLGSVKAARQANIRSPFSSLILRSGKQI